MLKIKLYVLAAFLFTALLILPSQYSIAIAACADDPSQEVNWEGCRKRNLMLSGTDMTKAKLGNANFTSTDMRGSQFDDADFNKAVLFRVAFDESSAKNANFEKAIGYRVSFKKTDLTSANFHKSEMQRVDFSGSRLTGANFSKSEAGRTNYDEAIMGENDFSFANIARANFTTAIIVGSINFEGAYFFLTRIEGVDLSKTKGLVQWQIDMACGDKDTKLPEGLSKPASWPCT